MFEKAGPKIAQLRFRITIQRSFAMFSVSSEVSRLESSRGVEGRMQQASAARNEMSGARKVSRIWSDLPLNDALADACSWMQLYEVVVAQYSVRQVPEARKVLRYALTRSEVKVCRQSLRGSMQRDSRRVSIESRGPLNGLTES